MFSSHNRQGSLRWLAALILGACAVAGVIRADAFAPTSVQAQDPAGYTFYLPMFQGFTPKPKGEEWATYVSRTGGYSFRYPADWTIEEYNTNQAVVELSMPTDARETRITFGYLAFEKPEDDDLREWAHYYFNESPAAGPMERIFTPTNLAVEVSGGGDSQQVYFQSMPAVFGEGYLIAHGRLVLQIATLASEASLLEIFDTLANSITFAVDAPVNFEQLYAPDSLPAYVMLEDYVQYLQEREKIGLALNLRLETGEDPNKLLDTMPRWAQEEYEALLIRDERIIEAIDQQRESPSAEESDPSLDEEWATYVSRTGGYSFRYPADWTIEEYNNKRSTVLLRAPSDPHKIRGVLEYLAYEKPETDDLLDWAQRFSSESVSSGPVERLFTRAELESDMHNLESEVLHFRAVLDNYGQGYFITHGRLVLEITVLGNEESDLKLLHNIANSITFTPDAPMNLEQLYDAPPSLSVLPDSPLFHANQADSPLAPPATPIPAHLQGLVQYRAFSVYGETFPRFEVWYDPETWEFHEQYNGLDGVLVHWHLVGCELWLPAGAGGAERIARVQLAGREWGIFELGPTMLAYSTRYETIAFTFVVMLPEAYSLDAKSLCQEAAEAVIDTFSIQLEKSVATRKEITQEIAIYHGASTYHNYTFEIHYSPETWEYIERDHVFGDLLRHRHVPYCILSWDTGSLPFHTVFRGTVHIAKRDWVIYTFPTNMYTTTGKYSLYSLYETENYFAFEAIMSDEVSLENSSLCQREIEEVIDTFKLETGAVWKENDASTSTPTMADSPLSQANQADSPLAPPVTPIPAHLQGLVQYHGFSIYGEMSPPFEVWYNPETWELYEKYNGRNYTLVHRHLVDCELWLQAGPVGGTERIATVQLAGREWNMFMRQPTRLSNSTLYENLAFLFGLSLAEEFSPDVKSPCQEAAEAVIDTFSVVLDAK